VKNLSVYSFSCQVDHVLVVGEEDHLDACRQIPQNFQGCPGAGVVEVDERIVYDEGKGLAVGDELFKFLTLIHTVHCAWRMTRAFL